MPYRPELGSLLHVDTAITDEADTAYQISITLSTSYYSEVSLKKNILPNTAAAAPPKLKIISNTVFS